VSVLVTTFHVTGAWTGETQQELENSKICIEPFVPKLISAMPDYFVDSLNTAFDSQEITKYKTGNVHDINLEFLADTKLEITTAAFSVFDKGVLLVRMLPPFWLADLEKALNQKLLAIPAAFDAPVKLSAEIPPSGALGIVPLSTAEQDLRAFPPTEWVWSVEPTEAGRIDAFLKFHVVIGKDSAKQTLSFIYPIAIKVSNNWVLSTLMLLRANWQWFMGTLLIPFAIFLLHYGRSKIWPPRQQIGTHTSDVRRHRR
jgi:hypothetical protein